MAYADADPMAPTQPRKAVPAASVVTPQTPAVPQKPRIGDTVRSLSRGPTFPQVFPGAKSNQPGAVTPIGTPPLTSTAGDGFGAPAPTPTPAPVAPAGPPITSTAGDGFGSPPFAPTPAPTTSGGVGLTPTNPANPLTGQTITPGVTDRFALARQKFDQFVESSDPAYKAALRDANRYGAANGMLGSGGLRTEFGNLANTRDLNLRTAERGYLTDALQGTIDDSRFATGVAQQQQGFQSEQQQRAFENELRRLGFSEDLINSAFGRALQTFNAGNTGGTGAGTMLGGAASAGAGAGASTDALAELLRQLAASRPPATTTRPAGGP